MTGTSAYNDPPVPRPASVEVDAALVAQRLGLPVAEFRTLMRQKRISVLCERGTDEDAGLYRATFYYAQRRARFVLDRDGRPVEPTG